MVRKSHNRFYIFGVALIATLYFFGVRPDHHVTEKHSNPVLTEKLNVIHSPGLGHLPFEIENREEQPGSEDDETKEASVGDLPGGSDSIAYLQDYTTLSNEDVVSKPQTEYHTPAYVRLRSILI